MREMASTRTWTAALAACGFLLASHAWAHDAKGTRAAGLASRRAVCASIHGEVFQRTDLFFGMNRPLGLVVTPQEFQNFIDTKVTPRFPDGLTVVEAKGQFRGASGNTERENSRVLILLYTLDERTNELVEQIREDYRAAFDQKSVLRVDETVCRSN